MKCISPITFRKQGNLFTVPCGKCNFCIQKKMQDWSFRLRKELDSADSAFFVTLTYSDDNIILVGDIPTLSKKDLQLFLKRLRKKNEKVYKSITSSQIVQQSGSVSPSVRYFGVGEYGTKTNRPHYHIILFNVRKVVAEKMHEVWKKGNVHLGQVTNKSIGYTLGYMVNRYDDYPEGIQKPFSLMSRRPGIGENYIKKNREVHLKAKSDMVISDGFKVGMPRYYRDKIFTYSERMEINEKKVEFAEKKESEFVRHYKGSKDPFQVLEERKITAHEKIEEFVNKKKKKI